MASPPSHRWLRRYAKLVCLATFVLIFAGSLVTSTGSGLAVPDWPLSYGTLFPPMVGGILYEHGHRLVAAGVGLLTVGLAIALAVAEPRPWLRRLGLLAAATVVAQGVLGGIGVLLALPVPIAVGHAVLGQTFLLLTVTLAYGLSRERARREQGPVEFPPAARTACAAALAVIFLQLILGAVVRHTGAGLAIPDFPLAAGRLLPALDADTVARLNTMRAAMGLAPVTVHQVAIHLAHRLGAVAVILAATAVTTVALRPAQSGLRIMRAVLALDGLVVVQVVLGAATVWSHKAPYVASLHVVTGAALLATSMVLVLRALPVRRHPPQVPPAPATTPGLQPSQGNGVTLGQMQPHGP